MYGILEYTEINPNYHKDKDKENDEDSEEEKDTQDMKIDHPEEVIILYDNEDKDDDVIDEDEVD